MAILALGFCLFICGFGILGLVSVPSLQKLVYWFDSLTGWLLAAAFRIILGSTLAYIAQTTVWPLFTMALAFIMIAGGVILLLLGIKRFHKIIEWWCGQSISLIRGWSVLALAAGLGLSYLVWGAAVAA